MSETMIETVIGTMAETMIDIRIDSARDGEPPPTLGSLLVASLFFLPFGLSEEELLTLVCSWHLPWVAAVILMLLCAVLVIAVSILVLMAVAILWDRISVRWSSEFGNGGRP